MFSIAFSDRACLDTQNPSRSNNLCSTSFGHSITTNCSIFFDTYSNYIINLIIVHIQIGPYEVCFLSQSLNNTDTDLCTNTSDLGQKVKVRFRSVF